MPLYLKITYIEYPLPITKSYELNAEKKNKIKKHLPNKAISWNVLVAYLETESPEPSVFIRYLSSRQPTTKSRLRNFYNFPRLV